MDILIVTPRADFWGGFKEVFEKHGATLRFAPAMPEALASMKDQKAALALLDIFGGETWNAEAHSDALKKAVISILMQDAMTNTASSCGMGEETFHDAMEGLGMINDLPALPSAADVDDLLTRLSTILGQF